MVIAGRAASRSRRAAIPVSAGPGAVLQAGTRYADYESPALEAIRSATAIVAREAPAELPGFRAFLAEIAATVADANKEGGFFGLGAQRRTDSEAAALEAVQRATRLEDAEQSD